MESGLQSGLQRPSWDEYFIDIAYAVGKRSTCLRRHVGAIAVLGKRILSTGYNGAPSGLPHCAETGCLRAKQNTPSGERLDLCRGVHAEMNALLQGAKHGTRMEGATLYVTEVPCNLCSKAIINAGIVRVVAIAGYPNPSGMEPLRQAGVKLDVLPV